MYFEYCNYNKYIENYSDEFAKIFAAIDNGLTGFALPMHLIHEMKGYLPNDYTIATGIDFPCGYSVPKVRNHMILNAVKAGVNTVDLVPNQYFLREKFSELAAEIETSLAICKDNGAKLRVFLDYHYISNIVNIGKIMAGLGVETVFPTIGYHHDDYFDNLINSKLLEGRTPLQVIFNGYMWTKEQLDRVIGSEVYGVRLYNLKLWCNNR